MASQSYADRLERANSLKKQLQKKEPQVRRHTLSGSVERANFDNWWDKTCLKKEGPGLSVSEHDTRHTGSRRQSCPSFTGSLSVSEHDTAGTRGPPVRIKSCVSLVDECEPDYSPTRRKKVRFHEVEIREFERIPGDNPSTAAGPAISLAWDHHEVGTLGVHEYEESRPPRRNYREIQMPAATRIKLLHKAGHSPQDIRRSENEVARERRNRSTSAAMQEFETLQIAKESLGRKWRRWRKGKSSVDEHEDEQDELWKNANNDNGNKKALERRAPKCEAPPTPPTTPDTSTSTLFEEQTA